MYYFGFKTNMAPIDFMYQYPLTKYNLAETITISIDIDVSACNAI